MALIQRNLDISNMNPNWLTLNYNVRGTIETRANELEIELSSGVKKPFYEIIRANVGDFQAMGQEPITFMRQVMALCIQPELMDSFDYPDDAKQRARTILNGCRGSSIGAYTQSQGIVAIRKQVTNFIKGRDGIDSDYKEIYLTEGATSGMRYIISMLNWPEYGKAPAIMSPIPQYPLFHNTVAEFGMHLVGYYLDDSNNWAININELRRAIAESRKEFVIKAIIIINPGNPTGQVMSSECIMDFIRFANEEKIILLADEVYQQNIYDPSCKFHSFKKTMMDMGSPFSETELVSFNSTSKGYLGECGIRGGYMEVCNFQHEILQTLQKVVSSNLCPCIAGQIAVSVMVNPPRVADPSYRTYIQEKNDLINSLKARAALINIAFNSFEGFSCNRVQGAMYAFPQIKIPQKAIDAAYKANMDPDEFYCFDLLESTGICVIPGSVFKIKPGSYYIRSTILPQMGTLKIMLSKFNKYHLAFMEKYK